MLLEIPNRTWPSVLLCPCNYGKRIETVKLILTGFRAVERFRLDSSKPHPPLRTQRLLNSPNGLKAVEVTKENDKKEIVF